VIDLSSFVNLMRLIDASRQPDDCLAGNGHLPADSSSPSHSSNHAQSSRAAQSLQSFLCEIFSQTVADRSWMKLSRNPITSHGCAGCTGYGKRGKNEAESTRFAELHQPTQISAFDVRNAVMTPQWVSFSRHASIAHPSRQPDIKLRLAEGTESRMELRLGQLLIESGLLSTAQVERILREQHDSHEPFGVLAERLFDVHPEQVERAWATQYATLSPGLDLANEFIDPRALACVTRRQAWQFRLLPLRFDDSELMMATTQQHLRRALRFATGVMGIPVFLVLASTSALGEALCRHYPLPGMTPQSVADDGLDYLLGDRSLKLA
jgi:hypothetical protein